MHSILLYHYPGSTSTFPRLLLEYCGIEHELKIPDPSNSEFAAINPKKQVPVLIVDNNLITENPAIAHAINQLAPEKHLFGNSPLEFIRVCEWLNWISATVHAQAWGPYVRPSRFTTDQTAEASVRAAAAQRLQARWDEIESKLGESDSWAVGEGFTAVDAFLLQFMRFAKNGMGLDMQKMYPKWTRLVDRMLKIEAIKTVFEADEMLKKEMAQAK